MIGYAARTGTKRNLKAIHDAGWRIMLPPCECRTPPPGFRFAIDNGAWTSHTQGTPWSKEKFEWMLDAYGTAADFIVVPDVVADAAKTFASADYWIPRMRNFRLILLALQDGMSAEKVGEWLEDAPNLGLFLGGSTEYKLREMHAWGVVAHAFRRYYHVARVNTRERIRLAHEAGAHSFDGSSVSRFSKMMPRLDDARRQPSLLSPQMLESE